MRKTIIAGFCLWALSGFVMAQDRGYLDHMTDFIENPSVMELGQEEGRSYFIPQKSLSLNGDWKFFYSDVPEGIPSDFYKPGFNDKAWNTIPVPSNWEMQGYGDKLFRNTHAPFKADPPHVPTDYNPTGAYRRTFTLPASWKGDQVFLRMEKVASASFVWINGQEVGYNEGAQEPAEYNITKYLKPGKNSIAVHVLKYSDGYYMEGQDYWRLAGIFDDVWVYATPQIRLFDWYVVTDLDESYTDANLELQFDIKKYSETAPTGDYKVVARLLDAGDKLVAQMESPIVRMDAVGKKTVRLSQFIKNPAKWTSETPNLYTLKMELQSADGKVQDSAQARIGFKETLIKGETFYLNGVPLKVNAQNSHMQDAETGHMMTEAVIRKDFETLKQFNFNAVRTCHYPPVNKYLELADEYGLFIIDETGDEAHATEFISKDPVYIPMYQERVRQLVLRDRNHPCVLFWSAGNESGEGPDIGEVIKEGRKYDHTRYWMYGGNAFSHPAEEIIGPRYPTPMELETRVGLCPDPDDVRPSFMDEYLSLAGNGGGAMDDFWRVVYSHPRTMGGAIWDYVTVGLKEKTRRLKDQSAYDTPAHIMGNARLVPGKTGKALDLNGHDQWVEVYRKQNVEISGDQLSLTFDVFPRKLVSSCGSFLTKGNNQFGIEQRGKDKLEFYLYPDGGGMMSFFRPAEKKKKSLIVSLPENWEYNWHNVLASYDGKAMTLYIDGEKAGELEASGPIKNFPFPVNIGKNAEVHGQETDVYICDAILDNVGIFTSVLTPESEFGADKAALWLDFESETEEGSFYSYGLGARTYGSIWPDRSPQPEMWEMKKAVQPISISWLDAENGWIEVWNRNHFLNSSYYQTKWFLEEDGKVIDEGVLDLNVAPLAKQRVRLDCAKPALKAGAEYRITVSSTLRSDECWASKGFEVAWDQLELPWHKDAEKVESHAPAARLQQADGQIIVSGNDFKYTFDEKTTELVSMVYKGTELLKEPLRLNVWRAPIANELDQWNSRTARSANAKEGYGQAIAAEYYSNGLDQLRHLPISIDAQMAGDKAVIRVRELSLTGNSAMEQKDLYTWGFQSNGFENIYSYTISGDGQIELHHKLRPEGTMPLWLPRIGVTLTLDKALSNVEWYGRGPQENYPDRKTGYKIGVYDTTVDDMYEPYLIPQDHGLRTDNRWLKMTNEQGLGLMFSMNELFNFNAYPYSTENLTKAMFSYQLERQDGITLNLDYATSGVGCTSRGIFASYRAYPQGYDREIKICPVSL